MFYQLKTSYSPKAMLTSGESWKYSTGQKNGIHVFGYNSAESEPIGMKSGNDSQMLRADFWRDPYSSDSLRGSRIFFVR